MIVPPNLWLLSGDGIAVRYSADDGRVSYQDPSFMRNFTPAEVRFDDVFDLGILVSVTIEMFIDVRSTTFTLLLPRVRLDPPAFSQTQVAALGITTNNSFSFGPMLATGALQFFKVTAMNGTASYQERGPLSPA